jgi:hypothetical protein
MRTVPCIDTSCNHCQAQFHTEALHTTETSPEAIAARELAVIRTSREWHQLCWRLMSIANSPRTPQATVRTEYIVLLAQLASDIGSDYGVIHATTVVNTFNGGQYGKVEPYGAELAWIELDRFVIDYFECNYERGTDAHYAGMAMQLQYLFDLLPKPDGKDLGVAVAEELSVGGHAWPDFLVEAITKTFARFNSEIVETP